MDDRIFCNKTIVRSIGCISTILFVMTVIVMRLPQVEVFVFFRVELRSADQSYHSTYDQNHCVKLFTSHKVMM